MPQPPITDQALIDAALLYEFFEEYGTPDAEALASFGASGWFPASKVGGLIYQLGSLGSTAYGADAYGAARASQVRGDMIYAHFLTEGISGSARKLASGDFASASDKAQSLMLVEAITGYTAQIGTALATSYIGEQKRMGAEMLKQLVEIAAEEIGMTDEQKEKFKKQTSFDSLHEDYTKWLSEARGQAETDIKNAQAASNQANRAAQTAQKAYDDGVEILKAAQSRAAEESQKAKSAYETSQEALEKAAILDEEYEYVSKKFDVAKDADPKDTNDMIELADAMLDLAERRDEQLNKSQDALKDFQTHSKTATDALKEADDLARQVEERHAALQTAQQNAQDTAQRIESAQSAKDIADAQLTDIENSGYVKHIKFATIAAGADSGVAVFKMAAGLAATNEMGDGSPLNTLGSAGYMSQESLNVVTSALDFAKPGLLGPKLSGSLAVAGAVAGLASAAGGLKGVVKSLDDPNLTDEQRSLLKAEIGLQSAVMGLSAMEGVASIMAAVSTSTKVASAASKAVPVLGAIAAVAGAINPAQWSEFNDKQDRIDSIDPDAGTSDALLADVLGDTLKADKAFYGSTTAIDGVLGIATAGLAATGVGLPVAAIVGILGGAISGIVSAFKQTRLESIADGIADKMRHDTDGNAQSIEDYFDGSFEERQDTLREAYEEQFAALTQEGAYDQVVGLGSQTLSSSDLALAAISKTAGEMGKTAKHYADGYTADGGWSTEDVELNQKDGTIDIAARAAGDNVYLTFMSPLMAPGAETTEREKTGKREFTTSLTIKQLSGWTVTDKGENATAFNMSKVINVARDLEGNERTVDFVIDAGAGDDAFFGYDSAISFDGGAGKDTASYARLDTSILNEGVTLRAEGAQGVRADKTLRADSKVYAEGVGTHTETHGKRTETIEYRYVHLEERGSAATVTDHLTHVEVLHGSGLGDDIDMTGSQAVQQIFGFDGDDRIVLNETIELVSGGTGDDVIVPGEALDRLLRQSEVGEAELEDVIFLDGGEGRDTVRLSSEQSLALRTQFAEIAVARDLARQFADALAYGGDAGPLKALLESYIGQGAGDDFALLAMNDVETVAFDLAHLFDHDAGLDAVSRDELEIGHTSAQLSGEAGLPFSARESVVSVWSNADLNGTEQMPLYGSNHDPDMEDAAIGRLDVQLEAHELRRYSGEIWLEGGVTYHFREKVDNWSRLDIGGEMLSINTRLNTDQTVQHSVSESGWFSYDFYAYNTASPGDAKLEIRADGMSDFVTFKGEASSASKLDGALAAENGLHYATRNGTLEIYSDADIEWAYMTSGYADSHVADSIGAASSLIASNDLNSHELAHYSGEIYLEADRVYEFRETVDDLAKLTIDGEHVLQNPDHDVHTSAKITVENTGWHIYDFYAYNHEGPGNLKLEIRAEVKGEEADEDGWTDYVTVDAETQLAAELDASGLSDGVYLIGDDLGETLIGGAGSDGLFAARGADLLDGGAGNDVLSGGAGPDTIVFGMGSGHDMLIEVSGEDWADTSIKANVELSQIKSYAKGDDLVLSIGTADSLTLASFYDDDKFDFNAPRTIRLTDKTGAVWTFDEDFSAEPPTQALTALNDLYRSKAHAASDHMENARSSIDMLEQFKNGDYEDQLMDSIVDMLF